MYVYTSIIHTETGVCMHPLTPTNGVGRIRCEYCIEGESPLSQDLLPSILKNVYFHFKQNNNNNPLILLCSANN